MEQQVISVHYQRMEEWLKDRRTVLEKKHRREYARLLELAPKLEQLIRYDIPALQKQQKKLSGSLDDSFKAIEEAEKNVQIIEEKRKKLLQEYGLIGVGPSADEGELNAAIDERIVSSTVFLNEKLKEFGDDQHFAALREAYGRIAKEYSMGMYDSNAFSLHFPWLERIYAERFCSLRVNRKHDRSQKVEVGEGTEDVTPCNIDWGDVDESDPIDMEAAVEIQWNVDEANVVLDSSNPVIAAAVDDDDNNNKDVEEDELPERVSECFSIDVSNATHRHHVLTELQALRCFGVERSTMGDDALTDSTAAVDALLWLLTVSTEASFVRMSAGRAMRASLLESLRRLRPPGGSATAGGEQHAARVRRLREELEAVEPRLEEALAAARANREECLAELAKMFPGRSIAIVGDINKYI
ncbi:putative dynein heavy chain [Trypanosoma theileri]|uniref:Putative dynein heavy chain n=1 Tax=Trypanosoma theileri TaxID=67003 RepID=A0A1X0P1A0_9TRYP|nr:putative dynein heavy chain [Trypanosoma theileri]ORC90692.1 putative dynein heavy chain [Trypanosoma theileri]